ncbi:MAG TPA: hypothetical protein PLL09_06995 [Flavobacterium sp.]|uniref:hypothetical protein n=1 Tax=unclassified Flavobacterium TaxID=196869 RepID=UPI0025BB1E60|nr:MULTISPECIES: hypothetical protein [unclassified Flavobacterium]HRE77554.1 hypothetical protein [Flavobacterium sp.]
MGLTIHYSGKLKSASLLSELIDEIKDIAKTNEWKYFVFEDKFPKDSFSKEIDKKNLYGIMLNPPGSEPVCFSFLNNGKMCGILNHNHLQIDPSINGIMLYTISTKTQFSTPEIHQKIILLLDYVKTKYLKKFECYDEGKFWETRDKETLVEIFERNERLINSFSSAIEMIPKNEGENLEDYLIRMAEIINSKEK